MINIINKYYYINLYLDIKYIFYSLYLLLFIIPFPLKQEINKKSLLIKKLVYIYFPNT